MQEKFKIYNRCDKSVLFTAEIETTSDLPRGKKLGLAVQEAVKSGISLFGSNLPGADLRNADLSGADFYKRAAK